MKEAAQFRSIADTPIITLQYRLGGKSFYSTVGAFFLCGRTHGFLAVGAPVLFDGLANSAAIATNTIKKSKANTARDKIVNHTIQTLFN